ncbi:cation transporter [Dehalobacterium formicoaceticum]|uniref:cation transporter n=1 Tax=Dehalobacterium formicoaceticum TaxID=51515 RepID=UPI000B7EFA65
MTDFLLRIFVKNSEETNNPDVRGQIGTLASWTGIILNILLVAGKGTAGIISGSLSVIADGFNNLMDAAGSVVNIEFLDYYTTIYLFWQKTPIHIYPSFQQR